MPRPEQRYGPGEGVDPFGCEDRTRPPLTHRKCPPATGPTVSGRRDAVTWFEEAGWTVVHHEISPTGERTDASSVPSNRFCVLVQPVGSQVTWTSSTAQVLCSSPISDADDVSGAGFSSTWETTLTTADRSARPHPSCQGASIAERGRKRGQQGRATATTYFLIWDGRLASAKKHLGFGKKISRDQLGFRRGLGQRDQVDGSAV